MRFVVIVMMLLLDYLYTLRAEECSAISPPAVEYIMYMWDD